MADESRPLRASRPPLFRALTRDDCGDDDGLVCPLLLDKIPLGAEIAVCGNCATIHDAGAWRENRGCASLGCPSAPNARRDAPDSVLRVSTEDVARAVPNAPRLAPPPPVPPLIPDLRASA
ncbi:MAG: Prokaryotic finger family 1, partial [Planctomycetota bacterium]